MGKRYIVCVDNSTVDQEKEFLEYLRENNFGWWHHLNNTWLLAKATKNSEKEGIRDNVRKIFMNENNMIFELNSDESSWAGFGPNTEDSDMFKWIKKNWK
jgi:hypothetical protein